MTQPLYVAFLWHMHQPYYRDASSGDFALPWTRLHATKDYLHMAEVLADYPAVHATFNIVPSLAEQLEEYAAGFSADRALRVSLKEHLSADDKEFILSFFFSINWDRLLYRYPPYRELARQREEAHGDWRRFPDQYWRDLVVWFNLAWFDPGHLQRDPELKALVDRGTGFNHADMRLVADKSQRLMTDVLQLYRKLQEQGQLELSASPYYHPILPLLVDSASAQDATPGLPLPPAPFAYPEDALEHVRRALLAHERVFGSPPQGMWPPEGAVSQAVANVLARHTDIRWIASDEAILGRSLGRSIDRDSGGHVTDPALLYQPYVLSHRPRRDGGRPLAIVFRDHQLSDRIGFMYQHMSAQAAADDLLQRLLHIREQLAQDESRPHLVSIILDGENCWEHYENNGDDFLRTLYGRLSSDERLRAVTISEYLDAFPPSARIEHLAAGSWIGGDMLTWIGEPAQNQAWECLARTRERLVSRAANDRSTSMDVIGKAWQEMYIAEGSDWFWWYSSRNNPNTDVFDTLFRGHLAEVYRNLGLPAPEWLGQPIRVERQDRAGKPPTGHIAPTLSAAPQVGHAWARAGYMEPDTSSATMQRTASLLRRLYYGYDAGDLYLRVELAPVGALNTVAIYLRAPRSRANRTAPLLSATANLGDGGWSHELMLAMPALQATLRHADGHEGWSQPTPVDVVIDGAVCEARLPLAELRASIGDNLALVLVLGRNGVAEERHPQTRELQFRLVDFGARE